MGFDRFQNLNEILLPRIPRHLEQVLEDVISTEERNRLKYLIVQYTYGPPAPFCNDVRY
jgi:hypothetical protein